jgi:ATP-dependent RNA helicase RhlE
MINDYFITPNTVSVAASGTPLENIKQVGYLAPNFNTKLNLLTSLLEDAENYNKVLVFVGYKKMADRIYDDLNEKFEGECCVIHSNKTQNYRLRSIRQFEAGENRILIATDVMARGLDIDNISHVINFDTPQFPENYMHRMGRSGRAEKMGNSLVFTTENEKEFLEQIEALMNMGIEQLPLPDEVVISDVLIPEEQTQIKEHYNPTKRTDEDAPGPSFHEKKEKNQKTNLGGSYRREIAKKYKKPKTKGDKTYNLKNKKKKR